MKSLLYFILAGSLLFASCNNAQESSSQDAEEHGHSHDGSSDHSHDAAGKEVPVQQEEFVVTDSTQTPTDTSTIKKEGTHTHEDGRTHADHD
jgi:hypothetical protein